MELNKIKVLSIFMIYIFCFIAHFLYVLFPSFFTSLLFPVNESVWEHMKMIVSSIMIWGIILYFIFKKNNYYFDNFFLSVLCISLCCVIIFLIMYFPLCFFFGDSFILNVILLFISIALSVNIGFRILNKEGYNLEFFAFLCIIFIFVLFGIFTYSPPKVPLFIDSRDGSYGISFD